jgi:hypothetical protein
MILVLFRPSAKTQLVSFLLLDLVLKDYVLDKFKIGVVGFDPYSYNAKPMYLHN